MAADHITLMIMVLGMATILTTMAGVTVPTTMVAVMLPITAGATTISNRIRITAIDIGQSTNRAHRKGAALATVRPFLRRFIFVSHFVAANIEHQYGWRSEDADRSPGLSAGV